MTISPWLIYFVSLFHVIKLIFITSWVLLSGILIAMFITCIDDVTLDNDGFIKPFFTKHKKIIIMYLVISIFLLITPSKEIIYTMIPELSTVNY